MADETPSEREERLQKAENRLQQAKERHKEESQVPERTRTGGGFGKAVAGIGSFFGEHRLIILAVVGFGIVAYIIYKSRSGATTAGATNQQGSLAGQQDANTASALQNLQTQLNNLRDTIGTIAQGSPGATGPQGPTGPQGSPGTTGKLPTSNWSPPLIPYSQTWSGKHYFPVSPGHRFDWQGVSYWIVSDTGGYIKGVPGATSASQAAGKSTVTLYAPSSAYQKPVLNPLASHSPIYNFMKLAPESVPGTDISHSATAFGPKRIVPVGHPYARTS